MTLRALCLAALATALLGACAKQGPSTPAVDGSATPPAAAARAAAATSEKPAGTAESNEPARMTRILTDDGSETVEETSGDTGAHNPLLAAVVSSAAAATTAEKSPWVEGQNYTRLVPAQPTAVGPGEVEVIEVFWYGCPHCYALDPLVEAWRKRKAPYVKFSRVPVMWDDDVRRAHARLFYTMENLGRLDELHPLAFKEIHVNNDMLAAQDPATSEQMQMAFLMKNGVSADQFKKTYHSFAVETQLQRAEQLTLRYRITGVPTFVINGKYVADVGSAQGPERLMSLIDDLAAREHNRQ